ncbi:MAG: hypothetical protein HYX61_05310 [Gammaproteobacteria bacterium]|jgi:hypothetical protein|nr:hypothetical protein [Gammaproteobacteria bacterium]
MNNTLVRELLTFPIYIIAIAVILSIINWANKKGYISYLRDSILFSLAGFAITLLIKHYDLSSKDYVFYIMVFLFCLISFLYAKEILNALIQNGFTTNKKTNNRWGKISFNDAIADELMSLRFDLLEMKIKQDNLGYDNIPTEFLKCLRMYSQYPYIGVCDLYKTSDNERGGMIIDLSEHYWFSDCIDNIFYNTFDSETLRLIKSERKNKIKINTLLKVHMFENEIGEVYARNAKIIDIKRREWPGNITLILEISILDELDFDHYCPPLPDEAERIEKSKIIRKIDIHGYHRHGIRLYPQDNSTFENYWIRVRKVFSLVLSWGMKNPIKFSAIGTICFVATSLNPLLFLGAYLGIAMIIPLYIKSTNS